MYIFVKNFTMYLKINVNKNDSESLIWLTFIEDSYFLNKFHCKIEGYEILL
jgi:hypothetical protein